MIVCQSKTYITYIKVLKVRIRKKIFKNDISLVYFKNGIFYRHLIFTVPMIAPK